MLGLVGALRAFDVIWHSPTFISASGTIGDDWQAIYRFAGSDIAVMREFGKRFGGCERIDLETTFPCWADTSIFDRAI